MFNAIQYFRDRLIQHDNDGHWANIQCPICRSAITGSIPSKKYLGFSLSAGIFNCWRCGAHDPEDVVMALENCKYHEACRRVREYDVDEPLAPRPKETTQAESVNFPVGTCRMGVAHREYLRSRGFNPEWLEEKYGLLGTGPVGDYANRIIIPIIVNGVLVSYQGRIISDNPVAPKYKACLKHLEAVHHKQILYNIDNATQDTLVVVEGAADVWKLGDGAVATFGTKFRWPQVSIMAGFKRVFVLFDPEEQAQRQALKIIDALVSLGVQAFRVNLKKGDPGNMPDDQAKRLMYELERG